MSGGKGSKTRKAAPTKTQTKAAATKSAAQKVDKHAAKMTAATIRMASARGGGHANPHAFQGNATHVPGISAKAEATLRTQVESLRSSSTQKTLMIDNATGKVMPGVRAQRGQGAGRVMVSNHTGKDAGAPTWTPSEYENVKRYGLTAAVMVTPEGMAVLRPGPSGKWADTAAVTKAYDQSFTSHWAALQAAQAKAARGGTKVAASAIKNMTAADISSQAWKDVARATGMRYNRVAYSTRAVYAGTSGRQFSLIDGIWSKIAGGSKTQEGRVASNYLRTARAGDIIQFVDKGTGKTVQAEITGTQHYSSLSKMLDSVGLRSLGFNPWQSKAEATDTYQKMFWMNNPAQPKVGNSSWTKLGWLSFGVRPAKAGTLNQPAPGTKVRGT